MTEEEELMRKWKREEEGLLKDTGEVVTEKALEAEDRRAGWRVRLAMWVVEKVGGSL